MTFVAAVLGEDSTERGTLGLHESSYLLVSA